MEDENLITVVVDGQTRHLFFHGTIDKSAAFNLTANLYSIRADLLGANNPPVFNGFSKEQESDNKEDQPSEGEPRIILHLNCPGGVVTSAFIIADTIMNLGLPVDCIAEGTVASAGVIVYLACNRRSVLPHAQFYLHETSHSIDGLDYNSLKRFASDANDINAKLKNFYLSRTTLTIKQINKLFKEESVLNYSDTIEYGIANQNGPINTF